jgi:TetR/AcrR family transcriptional regulator, transcriptional repressor for nem operon
MRYSAQHKERTHERLVRKAAEQFRRRGVQGIGIAKLMGKLGLTHGGFYAHFGNKSELVAAAARKIFKEAITQVEDAAAAAPKGSELTLIISQYLSAGHRDSTTQGCLLPSLAGEMSRQPQTVRKALTRGFDEFANKISKYMPGASDEERRSQARLLFSGMAGTMMVARAVSDHELSDTIVAQGREFYISIFQPRDGSCRTASPWESTIRRRPNRTSPRSPRQSSSN